ncbi:MAG: ribonuclease H-like domain-containing protein [Patescibacteria group bacterium]|jgi:DEAD/DEAH box helicase domain-containing protein
MNNKIVYDIETQKTFGEVGGLNSNHHKLGVSFVGVYSYSQNKYFGFLEKDIPVLEKILINEKPQIIGFNSKGFDNKVIKPYLKKLDIDELPQMDILEEIARVLGFRIKLESAAQATLGEGKSGTGLDAIRYYKEKDFDSLAKYCLDDVRITKDLFEYGRAHGRLYYFAGGQKMPIPISWGDAPTVEEKIIKAHNEHKRVKIKYFMLDEKQKKSVLDTNIDILKIKGQILTAFCHLSCKQKDFIINQILEAELTGEVYAHQASLV